MNDIQTMLSHASEHASLYAPWYLCLLAFATGIFVSFTPCLYPMIPITAGILHKQATRSVFFNFLHALAYTMGIATIYATLGLLSVKSSIIFGSWQGNPWFVAGVVAFFLYMAFAMLGFYELYIPSFLTRHGPGVEGNASLLQTFGFGALSGAVASPCLTPALALLLGIAARQETTLSGIAILFSFAMGMSMLLLLVGTFSSILTILPKADTWMEDVKRFFGFLMMGGCINFLQPFLTEHVTYLCYTLVCLVACLVYWFERDKSRSALFFGIISVLCAVGYGGYLLKLVLS